MTRDELLLKLRAYAAQVDDPECAHADADQALLEFINDPEVTAAFEGIKRWYA